MASGSPRLSPRSATHSSKSRISGALSSTPSPTIGGRASAKEKGRRNDMSPSEASHDRRRGAATLRAAPIAASVGGEPSRAWPARRTSSSVTASILPTISATVSGRPKMRTWRRAARRARRRIRAPSAGPPSSAPWPGRPPPRSVSRPPPPSRRATTGTRSARSSAPAPAEMPNRPVSANPHWKA